MIDKLLTAKEMQAILRVSKAQLFRLRSAGKLPAPLYIGRNPRWRETDISAWIDSRLGVEK